MKKSIEPLREKDYLFVFEKPKKISYPLLIFLLYYTPAVVWIVIKLYIIQITESDILGPYFINEFMWTYPGMISIALIAYLSKYIRNKAVENFNSVLKYVKEPNMIRNLMRKTFSSNDHIKYPLILGFIALVFQIAFLIIIPWPWWQVWYEHSYTLTLVTAIVVTFSSASFYYLIAMFGYFCLGELYTIHKIGDSLHRISFRELEMKTLSPLGSQALVVCVSWSIGVGTLLLLLTIAPMVWWTILQMAAFFASVLCFFLVSQYSIHKVMSDVCRRTSDKIISRFWDVYEDMERLSNKDDVQIEEISMLNSTLENLERIDRKIGSLPKWAFERIDILKIITILLITSALTVIAELFFKLLLGTLFPI